MIYFYLFYIYLDIKVKLTLSILHEKDFPIIVSKNYKKYFVEK